MAIVHITTGQSRDVVGASAFDEAGPGTLIVDANAFLIAESGGYGTFLGGSWTATIDGTLQSFDTVFAGLQVQGTLNSITIGPTGDVHGATTAVEFFAMDPITTAHNRLTNLGSISGGIAGVKTEEFFGAASATSIRNLGLIHGGDAGLEHDAGTLTLVNSGTIAGGNFSIHAVGVQPIALITNSGVLIGNVVLSSGADIFTDFKKVGHVIKSGTVHGNIDLGNGDDHFNGGSRAETVHDGSGSDIYKLGGGADFYLATGGGTGTDAIDGGKGSDVYSAAGASFSVLVNLDTKPHGGLPAQFAQGADIGDVGNTDTVIGFENAVGGSAADLLIGSSGANQLFGHAGTDDLIGLGGRDTLFGDVDGDRFIFQKLSDSGVKASTRDLILDFTQGEDHIHLVDLEASVGHAFTFIGTENFHQTAGELRQSDSGANTIVSLDANGDGKADFSIELTSHFVLTSGDFTL